MNVHNPIIRFLFIPSIPGLSELQVKQKMKVNCFFLFIIFSVFTFHGTMAIVKTGYFYSFTFRNVYFFMTCIFIYYLKTGKDGNKGCELLLYEAMLISFTLAMNQNTHYVSLFLPFLINQFLTGFDRLNLAIGYSTLRMLQVYLYTIPVKIEYISQIEDIDELKNLVIQDMFALKCSYIFCVTLSLLVLKLGFTRIKHDEELIRREELEKRIKTQENLILSFSHELNNPIHTIINNLSELKLMNNNNPKALQSIQATKCSVSFLSCFVNNILDISKIDKKNNLEFNPIHVKLKSFIDDLWENCQTVIESKKLKSKIKFPQSAENNKIFTFDPHRIRQIIYNIVNNSIKYTSKGKIKLYTTIHSFFSSELMQSCSTKLNWNQSFSSDSLQIESFNDINEGSMITKYLRIEVTDTGCGIAEQKINEIFKKQDIQENNTTNDQQQQNSLKLGISLWLVKQIIQKLDGQIKIHSKVGQGTSVVVLIPIIEQCIFEEKEKRFLIESEQPKNVNSKSICKNNILLNALIVEDVPFNQYIIKNYLAKANIKVLDTAENGQIAVQKYKELIESGIKIDMICMDIEMPIMNGKEASKQIREYEKEKQLEETRIFFVSGNTIKNEIEECLDKNGEIRGTAFLKKPLCQDEFQTTISSLMSEQ